ncbi:hypothetical protein Tco_0595252 [Tanacetum coccineum]
MIGSLMYLTASRHDIQFSTCLCARYQANPKESHLVAVKRIFRYLKGTPNLGLWYPKGSGFDLKAYFDSDYAGCNLDRKSTSGGCQILGGKLICWSVRFIDLMITKLHIMDEIDQRNKDAGKAESPYDTKSEIKIIKSFQGSQRDAAMN